METATQDYLRQAAMDALGAKNDTAALEILAMLSQQPAPAITHRPVPELPAARPVVEGPAHDYHYWAQFIRENFIPYMSEHGRDRFTSPELFAWIENLAQPVLTTGDIELYARGSQAWRNIASHGLSALKKQGVIYAPAWGKDYRIQAALLHGSEPRSLPAARRPPGGVWDV